MRENRAFLVVRMEKIEETILKKRHIYLSLLAEGSGEGLRYLIDVVHKCPV